VGSWAPDHDAAMETSEKQGGGGASSHVSRSTVGVTKEGMSNGASATSLDDIGELRWFPGRCVKKDATTHTNRAARCVGGLPTMVPTCQAQWSVFWAGEKKEYG
jgi:hypothetical protein